jgi:hypothetical protein
MSRDDYVNRIEQQAEDVNTLLRLNGLETDDRMVALAHALGLQVGCMPGSADAHLNLIHTAFNHAVRTAGRMAAELDQAGQHAGRH